MKDILLALALVFGAALVILAAVAAFIAWRIVRSDERKLAKRIGRLRFRDKISFGRDLARDARVPLFAKIVALAVVVYFASPIDLIPDFIPVLGHLDDVLIAIIGGAILLRSIPPGVIEEHLQTYELPGVSGQILLPR
ncbi:MAG: DUF1232 domain-containing protein [Chloroflexota bacterium]